MDSKPTNQQPRRQRRAPFVFNNAPTYFLTFCTENRANTLANNDLFERACQFVETGHCETDFFVSALMIMPDHIHALASIAPQSEQKIGNWVRAFKRTVGKSDIHWQQGFFDHILRSHESRSEKWEYIRNNPVRAELCQRPEDWPYQQWFHPATGENCLPNAGRDVRPAKNNAGRDVRPAKKHVGRTSLSGEKNELRKRIAAQRTGFQPLEELSRAIVEKLQGLELFQQAKTIGAYMPLPDEVNVTPLFQCWEHQFYIPAFDESIGGYRLAQYTPELKKGKFGIPEPAKPVWAGPDELDLILVPGVAFDLTGERIGRGGGFYDRLLPQYRAVRVGIGFGFQTLEKLPTEPHDCRLDWLVTESGILKFAMNS
jgi:5-formyltetrahydrofolate cyclo-ligase